MSFDYSILFLSYCQILARCVRVWTWRQYLGLLGPCCLCLGGWLSPRWVDAAVLPAPIRIGVLSHRGDEVTLAMWSPTAAYLDAQLPEYHFEIVPLQFDAVQPEVANGNLDFVLVNPGIYVNLEVQYRVSRIATIKNHHGDLALDRFGGVIFHRRDRSDLRELRDLRGQRVIAVDDHSLGGYQMAWRELHDQGLDPAQDFASLTFAGTHDQVVLAVLEGSADVGMVRTDILERMAQAGQIDLNRVQVLAPRHTQGFPYLHSTRLYPEWPFSKVSHTPADLAQAVAIALMRMPWHHPAAQAGDYAGWTIPHDYQPVHELFRELKLPPYQVPSPFTLLDAVRRYWYWVMTVLAVVAFFAGFTFWVSWLNRHLKSAKAQLESQHRLILNSVADGIYGVDLDGNSTFMNRAMEAMTGWSAEEVVGRNQHQMLHHTRADGSHHPSEECPVHITSRLGRPNHVKYDLFWRKNGSNFPVEYTATPIRDDHGRIMGSVVVFRDITERIQAEEKARQHQLELAHVARLSTMGEMASGIAHELNQPLTAISTNARACMRLLESGQAAVEPCTDVMEKIATQAERAGEVIRQIRHFIRKEEPERVPVSIRQIFTALSGLIDFDARQAGVTVRVSAPEEAVWVLAQEIQIEQVLLNLGRNAIEAMAEAGVRSRMLDIRAYLEDASRLWIEISDTGPGLSQELADRIFDPFVTTKAKGLGLGLSISKGIVEAHGSELLVHSRPGEGVSFCFSLPVYSVEAVTHEH